MDIRLPFLENIDQLFFFFYVLARVTGLFLISPLLSNRNITGMTRSVLVMFCTALMGMVVYPIYHGPSAQFSLPEIPADKGFSILILTINLGKELFTGFLIGFCFLLIFEALMLAGQLVGVMVGLSMAEILDPISGTSQSIVAQFFTLTTSLLVLTLDLHHTFFYVIAESFSFIPLAHYQMSPELIETFAAGSSRFFHYALQYSAIPYLVLFLVTFALGFMARVMPEMNIFMVGFPLKIFIGYYGMIASLAYFPLLLQEGFQEYLNMANRVIHELAPK